MSKTDRETAIIIAVVLIVCLVSLVAIGVSLWQLVGPGVNAFANAVGLSIKMSTLNYNFIIPESSTIIVSSTTSSSESSASTSSTSTSSETVASSSSSAPSSAALIVPANYTYNFAVPAKPEIVDTTSGFADSILSDAELVGYGSGADTPQTDLLLTIPKIGVKSPVLQGLGGDLLNHGFWVYPTSKSIGAGEMILLCHRRYFGKYDPRTCWYLDQVAKNDEIFLRRGEQVLKYTVIGTNVFDDMDPNIYTVSENNYLKIVTCTPLYSSEQRLVVLAKLEE